VRYARSTKSLKRLQESKWVLTFRIEIKGLEFGHRQRNLRANRILPRNPSGYRGRNFKHLMDAAEIVVSDTKGVWQ
jgi:hypothetical protein